MTQQMWLWAPAGMGKRGHLSPPPLECCKVFLCISRPSSSKTPSRGIILHYFHNQSSASGDFALRPHRGSICAPCSGTFEPTPLICPPLKILRAPMNVARCLDNSEISVSRWTFERGSCAVAANYTRTTDQLARVHA